MAQVSVKSSSAINRAARRARRAALSAGLAVTMTMALAAAANATAPAGDGSGARVSSLALGLNTAPWDYIYAADTSASGGLDVIQPLLRAADVGQ